MTQIFAKTALLPDGWHDNVRVTVEQGKIEVVETQNDRASHADLHVGILLPAPVNAHSHAFQRAMAGMTEARGQDASDSFWTWRALMYKFMDHLTPDQIEAITAFVHMEMLEAGFAASVEFHYVHHHSDGRPYDNRAETGTRIMAAAGISGIGLTLLPVHYQYGGCDKRPLGPAQRRFGHDVEGFSVLMDSTRQAMNSLPGDANLGVALHSLRAVHGDDFFNVAALSKGGPVHTHLAEQTAEIEEVKAAYGVSPARWLLDNGEVDENWCLIHCTHMTRDETRSLAATGAIAGICPITEANLGDGIFNATGWMEAGGRLAIGSDSNIYISLAEELRLLEYSQRLRDRRRAVLATGTKSTGRTLFDAVCRGGALSAGRESGAIATGQWADLLALDAGSITLEGRSGDMILDSFIFAGDNGLVGDVWSAGRHVVSGGRHKDHEPITKAYRKTLRDLSGVM